MHFRYKNDRSCLYASILFCQIPSLGLSPQVTYGTTCSPPSGEQKHLAVLAGLEKDGRKVAIEMSTMMRKK